MYHCTEMEKRPERIKERERMVLFLKLQVFTEGVDKERGWREEREREFF